MDHPWPLFGLTVTAPHLVLRYPTDDDVVALALLAARGIHPPEEMPFEVPWTDAPPDRLPLDVLRFHWGVRAATTPESWHLPLAVVVDGVVVGQQSLDGEEFAVRRTVSSGSWLGLEYQRRGIGLQMRAAALHLAFAGLGAVRAESSAFAGNDASHRISRALGYREDGSNGRAVRGVARTATRYLLTREAWLVKPAAAAEISGLDRCVGLLGAS